MPASSRKRNKGKDRKAKKEETKRLNTRNLWLNWTRNGECDHGCAVKVPDDHPVMSFLDLLFTNVRDNMELFENSGDTLQKYPEVWTNDTSLDMAINILTNIGTNMLLSSDVSIGKSMYIANIIVLLEHYAGEENIRFTLYNPIVARKMRSLDPVVSSGRRDALKFYRKRLSCKCLKKLHLEARKLPKTAKCHSCQKECGRSALSICSRCTIYQYCSRECQVADRPEHKAYCDLLLSFNQDGRDELHECGADQRTINSC